MKFNFNFIINFRFQIGTFLTFQIPTICSISIIKIIYIFFKWASISLSYRLVKDFRKENL